MSDDVRLDCSDMDEATDSYVTAIAKLTKEKVALRAKVVALQNALRSIEKDAKQMREASNE